MSDANGQREWDVALRKMGSKNNPSLGITIPAAVSRVLLERGWRRAKVWVSDEGIVVRPYPASEAGYQRGGAVDIPETWGAS